MPVARTVSGAMTWWWWLVIAAVVIAAAWWWYSAQARTGVRNRGAGRDATDRTNDNR